MIVFKVCNNKMHLNISPIVFFQWFFFKQTVQKNSVHRRLIWEKVGLFICPCVVYLMEKRLLKSCRAHFQLSPCIFDYLNAILKTLLSRLY